MVQYLYHWGQNPGESLNRAMLAAESLILADSSSADGFGLRGILRIFQRHYDLALADFARSLSLNQNAVRNLFFAAWGESAAGEVEMAKEHAHLGLRLSPREKDIWLGLAYLALTQASFSERDFVESRKWGNLSIQIHSKAPVRRALMVACCAYMGKLEEAKDHANALNVFSPEFIPNILRGDIQIFKMPDHNNLLVEGLGKAGFEA